MKRHFRGMFPAFALLIAVPALAGIKDIRSEKLPKDSSVAKAYTDAAGVEEYVRVWSDSWPYPISKDEVAARLKSSLAELQEALTSCPDNEELLLLTGLVAHYAHNVDVEGALEVSVQSLEKAHKLAPDDVRPNRCFPDCFLKKSMDRPFRTGNNPSIFTPSSEFVVWMAPYTTSLVLTPPTRFSPRPRAITKAF